MCFRKAIAFIFINLCMHHLVVAQQFGGTPFSTKWQQINTDTVRILFPQGLDSTAQRIASLVHYLQKNYSHSIGDTIRKIDIVLQKDITLSNAYVALGPYRSEFYLMPPQNAFELGAQDWAGNLAIHEFRHVQQFSNFRKGLSKAMYFLFGEDGQALANAAAIPNWFFEGDAVYNETMLSQQGRGRLPLFLNGFKSLFLADHQYNYLQLRNGSFKNYIPDHYPLGYMLVAYGREKYGDDFWRNVTANAVKFKPLFYPLQGSVKKYSGISFTQFANDAFYFYRHKWEQENRGQINWITSPEKGNVTDYKYPYITEDSVLIVLKKSFHQLPAFYKINHQVEQKIGVQSIANDDYYSFNGHTIIYAAFEADVRWGNRNYSVIKILDINKGKEQTITHKTTYFSPDISHNGKLIVAVAQKPNQLCDIDLLNLEGKKIQSLVSNSSLVYSYPKFAANDHFIFVIVRDAAGQMELRQLEIKSGESKVLIPFGNRIMGFPVVKGDTILYACSEQGKDGINAFVVTENKRYSVASYPTGLYQAGLNSSNQLIAVAFTANGYRLAEIKAKWDTIDNGDTLTSLYLNKPFRIAANNTIATGSTKHYTVKKYARLTSPFNFHSWRPSINDPDYSFIVYGENVLNTLQSQLYYTYNRNEQFSKIGYNAVYGGWYLQPVLGISETFQRNAPVNADTIAYWNELITSSGLQLPLNFSGGKQYRYLSLSGSYNTDNVHWTGLSKELFRDIHFKYASFKLQYTGQIQKALQHIYPHWAQTLLLEYRTITNKYSASQFLASGNIYLPGISTNHSIVLNAAFQGRDTMRQYNFTNSFPFSRGYIGLNFPRMWKLGINYHFTVSYPDWGLSSVVYFQRIRANVFYDDVTVKSLREESNMRYRSLGAEVYFDTKWWNQQPVTIGIRYSRLIDYINTNQKSNQWEIILPINLLN